MKKRSKFMIILNTCLTAIIILLVIALALLIFVVSPMRVSGVSMCDTYYNGQRVWLQKNVKEYNRGDIIVFKREGHDESAIKRIIGVPGDTITFSFEEGYFVNDEKLDEPYIREPNYQEDYFEGDKQQDKEVQLYLTTSGIYLQEGEYFVLGDNRAVSLDSHRYGAIKLEEIKGKVL